MKKLFLIRHAKSDWNNPNLSDIDRPLNKRGDRDAPFMANVLKKSNVIPELIYSSPAKRAFTTAKVFAKELGYDKNLIIINNSVYEAGIKDLEKIVQEIDADISNVLLFGHNMVITAFANHLGNKFIDNMPTCSIVGIEFDTNNWKNLERGSGNTFLFEYPKKYFH